MRILFLYLFAGLAVGQESVQYASIGVRAVDATQSAVENAQVAARQIETNATFRGLTDGEGRYRFPYLKPGVWEITVTHPGFAPAARKIAVTVGSAFDLPIELGVSDLGTVVDVTAAAAALETSRSQVAGTVTQSEVASLPLNGRSFLDLALLIPGVSPTNTGSNQLFAETSASPGQGISIGSQRNFSNSYIVDGLSANDDAAGLSGIVFGLDVVREFQVVTTGGQAELGRAMAGYVNMVTKSGGNAISGTVYGYFRNRRFNASNPLSHTTLPLTQAQYGASLGGPLARDKTFYFANFERRDLSQSGLITISPAAIAAIDAKLNLHLFTGLYPNPVHNYNGLGKIDHELSGKDQLSVRYSIYDVSSLNSRGAGALSAASASANLFNTDQTIAVGNVVALSPRTVLETRGQYSRSYLAAPPSDPFGPAVSISGVASFGTLSGSPTARINNLYEVANNLSSQAGPHAFKVGADYLYNDVTITFPRSVRGSYSFSSLANFLAGAYNNSGFTQTFGVSRIGQTNPNLGMYAQDEWKVGARFTLNLGFRYDLQFLRTVNTQAGNVSPRGGFAWTPFGDRRTVVRGNYGLFYDRIPLRALANALLSQSGQVSLSLSPTQTGAPVFPNILTSQPTGVLANLTSINPDIHNAYSEQGGLEIERQLTSNSSVTVGYQHLRGLHLIVSLNQNVPACVASGSNNGCRPNPNFGNNSQYNSRADSHYDGLHVSFTQRPIRWGSYRLSYSYSKSLDNVGEFFFSTPVDQFNIWRDYGRSDDDQRHRLVLDGTARLPLGLQLGGVAQYYSSLPLNIVTGSNTVQGTAARPVLNGDYIPRNSGHNSDFFTVNARLTRTFALTERLKMDALAEAFNLLNHRNNLTKNATSTSAAFGQVTSVNDPRSLQLALRLKF